MLATGSKSLNNYRLSIRVFADGFSFSVVNLFDGKEMRVWKAPFSDEKEAVKVLNGELSQASATDYEYTDTELIFVSPTTFVPLDAFHREDISSLYHFNFPTNTNTGKSFVECDVIPSLDVVVLYSLMKSVREEMLSHFPHCEVHSIDTQCLTWAYEHHRMEHHDGISFFATTSVGRLTICAFQRNRLLFACSYALENKEDCIYQILAAWKQLKLDERKETCYLAREAATLRETLKQFIKNIEICA